MRPEDAASYREMHRKPMIFSGFERDRLFFNVGRGKHYPEVAYGAGLDFDDAGRANVAFDYDGDGDLDLAVVSLQRLRLLENQSRPRHFVRLSLEAKTSQHHALGATVVVTSSSGAQRDYLTATSGFATGVPLILHFGLGDDTSASVSVTWPNGKRDEIKRLAADRHYRILEGGAVEQVPIVRWSERLEDVAPLTSYALPPTLEDLSGKPKPVALGADVVVVNFFASWCTACREEVPQLTSVARKTKVIGISLDEDLSAARRFVEETGMKYPVYRATPEILGTFFARQGDEVRLPATFIIGPRGLARAFFRPVTAEELTVAIRGVEAIPLARGDAETLTQQGTYRLEIGDSFKAIEALQLAARLDPSAAPTRTNLAVAYSRIGAWDKAIGELRGLLAVRPDHVPAITNLALALVATRRHAEALPYFAQLREKDPRNRAANIQYAASLIAVGRLDDAQRILHEWVLMNPADRAAAAALLGRPF